MPMSKIKKIHIDSKEIDDLINSLNILSRDLKKLSQDIPMEIAEAGLKYLNKQYATTPRDENIEDINTSISKTARGYNIVSSGKDVMYEEFGTGDKGQANPHKEKSKYSLKEYNSGPTIRPVNPNNPKLAENGITSGMYWTYDKNGKIIYTQGVPAGMQTFKTSNYLRSGVIKTILKEKASDVLSKV